jgi:hypothetical protein
LTSLTHLLDGAAVTASTTGLLYGATVSTIALTATFAKDGDRRAEAHKTLKVLLRRRSTPKD